MTLSTHRRLRVVPDEPPDERDAGRPPEPDADPYEVAREICLRKLAGRACTRAELATELRRRNVPDDAATAALDRLDAVGLIDDAAFAASFVDRQVRTRGLSRRAMTGELRRKGVDAAAAAEAVGVVSDDDERRRAAELVARKLPSVRSLDRPRQVNRLVGMLARKGYGGDVAYAVVRAALGDLDEEG